MTLIVERTVGGKAEPVGTVGMDRIGQSFVIRPYFAGLRAVLERFYADFEPKRRAQGLPPEGEAKIRSWLTTILSKGVHLVVLRHDHLIGHGLVIPTEQPGIGEYAVFLKEDQRGRGIGTELTRAVISAAREAGFAGLWLSVEPRNKAAIRSYEKAGFRFIPTTMLSLEPEMELAL